MTTMFKALRSVWCWMAGLALVAGLAWAAMPGTPPPPAGHATLAPLASKNLLLAGAQIKTATGGRLVAVGEHGHVLLSDDGGKAWRQAKGVPTTTTLTAVHFLDGLQGWAVGHGGVVLGTQDAGETWSLLSGKADGKEVLLSVHFSSAQQGLVVGAFGYAARTSDGGKTWQAQALAEGEEGERHLNLIFSGPEVAGQRTLWVAAEGGLMFRSDDAGARWQPVKLPYKGSIWGGMGLSDGALLVWGMGGHALRSDDGGKTFVDLPTGTEQSLGGGVQLSASQVVLAGLGGAVVVSHDAGRRFVTTVRDDRASLSAVLPGPPGQVVLLGQAGALLQGLAPAAPGKVGSAPR